jgi:hypothetical protein
MSVIFFITCPAAIYNPIRIFSQPSDHFTVNICFVQYLVSPLKDAAEINDLVLN